ncbi:hypothetical protein BaRGS_00024573, partial [Batillaria attramentaria]
KPAFAQPERNEITVETGSDMLGKFPLRTHTTDFTECLLSKYASNAYDRKGFSNRAQTVGECDRYFAKPSKSKIHVFYLGCLWKVITAVGVSVLVFLIIIVTIFCTRKGRKRAVIPQPAVELAVIQRRSLVREEDGSAPSVHIYWDADPPAADGEDVAEEAPPPICHRPGNPPDDYLNPEPSRDETQDEGAEFNTVPFYHNTQIRNVGATAASDGDSQTAAPRKWMSSHPKDGTEASDDNPDSDRANTERKDVTDYVGYDPRLYENTQL